MTREYEIPTIMEDIEGVQVISGTSEALEAWGQLLILKAKMGDHMSARLQDGENPSIEIVTLDRE